METARDIVDAIGRKRLRRRLGVSEQAISNALAAGSFPPAWYAEMLALSAEQRVSLPIAVFRWRAEASE